MKSRFLFPLLALPLASPAWSSPVAGTGSPPETAAESAATTATASRPRIGLVLGGGGAKGAAHVGVLKVLEELHVPIDCIVGTSMGALVGGIYASGVGAVELDRAVRAIPWPEVIAFTSRREKLPMRSKLSGVTYSNSIELGIEEGGVVTPRGFINTQNVEQTIRYLSAAGRRVEDFDKLPIPFRAVATDMRSGDMAVLGRGDLAAAMRASMAVPGVFAPVEIDGRVLGDGGLVRNLPVDVARELCADVVIAVALPNPPPTVESLTSPVGLLGRTMDVLIGANERVQQATLGPRDVSIVVQNADMGSASFDRLTEAIPGGRMAALGKRAELERLALPEAQYRAWQSQAQHAPAAPVRLAAVNVRGLERVDPRYVVGSLPVQAGDVVGIQSITTAVDDLYALDEFSAIEYRLSGDPAAPALEIQVTEKPYSGGSIRFDVGLYADSDDNTDFILGGDLRRNWVNRRGGQWHAAFQLGRTSALDASFYQPLDPLQRWFVEPSLRVEQSIEDLYVDGQAAARYDFDSAVASLEAGHVFGRRAELRFGLHRGLQSASRGIAPAYFPDIDSEDYAGFSTRYVYDSRDRAILATRGWLARAEYFRGEDALGAVADYDRLEALVQNVQPIGDNVMYLRVTGGTALDSDLPIYDAFTLGGPLSFPGLAIGELRGQQYWTANATYLHKVADISALFGQAFYLGVGLTVGDMSERIDRIREDPIGSASLLASARTPLGPVSLSLATTTLGDWQLALTLGRPIEERAISDPTW